MVEFEDQTLVAFWIEEQSDKIFEASELPT